MFTYNMYDQQSFRLSSGSHVHTYTHKTSSPLFSMKTRSYVQHNTTQLSNKHVAVCDPIP